MLPFFAFALPTLVLLCGLLLDVGLMENQSLAMQNAADAASLGAELEQERGTSNFVPIGQSIAALNGFANGSGQTTVTVVQQPASGAFAGNFDAVEVRITAPVQTILMQYLNSATVSVRSVSVIPPCVYLSGSSAQAGAAALSATSSTASFACPAYSNGPLSADGSSSLSATAWNLTGNSGSAGGGGSVAPSPHFNAPALPDPLAGLAEPSAGSCTYSKFAQNGGSATLQPGVYCNGLALSNTSVSLAPGLYVVTGGATWSNAQVRGTGVTLFLTQGGGASFGQFVISGNSNITLSAPVDASSGGLPGVLLFGDRQWSATSAFDLQIRNSSVQADGVVYTTNTGLLLSSSTLQPSHYLGLDIAGLSLTSSKFVASGNFSSVTTGSPFRSLGGNVE